MADPIHLSDEALRFARAAFVSEIEELLDDPSYLLHPWRECEPLEELDRYRRIAINLGIDFDDLIARAGTDFERERLRLIIEGVIKPASRERLPYQAAEAAPEPDIT
jgi:hypothetical protein